MIGSESGGWVLCNWFEISPFYMRYLSIGYVGFAVGLRMPLTPRRERYTLLASKQYKRVERKM